MSALTVITGLPGNGKTLYAVQMMRELKAQGRMVLQKNVNGLDPSIAQEWPHPLEQWKTLPPGAVLFVDESQDFAASNGKGGSPEWVKEFSKVRHGGIEIVFITQDPRFLDPWIRRLCGRHIHVMRKMGMQMAVLHEWDRIQDNPVDYHALQASNKTTWKYPKELFALYKSANIHTVKRRIPKKLYFFLLLIVLVIGLIWFAAQRVMHPVGVEPAKTQVASLGATSIPTDQTAGTYAAKFTPLVQSMPWSAPAYSDLKPSDFPVLYCMDSELKGCRCFTQQITRYYVDEKICKVIVRDGVFNPFKSQMKDADRDRRERDRDEQATRREADQRWPVSADGTVRVGEGAEAQPAPSPARSVGSNLKQVPGGADRMDAARW